MSFTWICYLIYMWFLPESVRNFEYCWKYWSCSCLHASHSNCFLHIIYTLFVCKCGACFSRIWRMVHQLFSKSFRLFEMYGFHINVPDFIVEKYWSCSSSLHGSHPIAFCISLTFIPFTCKAQSVIWLNLKADTSVLLFHHFGHVTCTFSPWICFLLKILILQ